MVEMDEAQIERREHLRILGKELTAEIAGKQYEVLDISYGGIKVHGRCAAAGALLTLVIVPSVDNRPIVEEQADVRGRVARVDGERTVIHFSNLTDALTKLICARTTG
jgi:hypothetical protein